jgi:class 3 adenylate cyclase
MRTLDLRDSDPGSDTWATTVSGHEPINEHRPAAEPVLAVGGNGLGLIGANPAPGGAGRTPTCIPGPGVDTLLARLVDALMVALVSDDQEGGRGKGAPVRENVTLLFSDIVGWTETAVRVGPDCADHLRRRHFSTLHRAVEDNGGAEVKRLGDGVMVAFSTASAALTCAVAMQRSVAHDNCVDGHPLGLRVGLSGGEVMREGSDFFGDPVVEAARLCSSAEGGKILISGVVKGMAGRRVRYPYRALGGLDLKGLPEPLETFEVSWKPMLEDMMPTARPLAAPLIAPI